MVTLTIDGVEVTVERGTSILEAAQQAGKEIPTLCHDKRLVPYGSCRLCMVEVTARGKTRTMPACFNPARDGMEVVTQSQALTDSRRMQLMLILRSHPLRCPSCDASGNCRLQDLVHEYEIPELPFPRESRVFHVDNDSHFIRFNMNLCIKCGMCVRICDEIQGEQELSFVNRGMNCEVSTDFERPLNCEFCGQCAQICPVGAISLKWLVGTGYDFELKYTDTTCAFCSLGCVLSLGEKADKIVSVVSPPDSHNEGNLCVKGRFGWPYIYSEKRLTQPLIRKNGSLEPVDWNEALTYAAKKLSEIKEKSGGASLAGLGSERLTNEEAYVFGRFVRTVLGSPNVDHAAGYGYRGLVDGLMPSLGYPASTGSITEMRHADVILLVGADLTETHPVAKNEVIQATGKYEGKAIVIDSAATKLTKRPGIALLAKAGSEHLVAWAILKEIVDKELFDREAVERNVEGLDELIASLADYTPERVGKITGVNPDAVREAAELFAKAKNAVIALTDGMNRLGINIQTAQAAAALALVTGRLEGESNGVMMFGENANAQGTVDMGLTPDLLPGFASVTDEEARTKLEELWGTALPEGEGLNAGQILHGCQTGEIKGLYIAGENPPAVYPDRDAVMKSLRNVEFLVVQDMFMTETAEMAHVVLPTASFAEKTGTFTSAERFVQLLTPARSLPGVKTDLEIFQALASSMGAPSMTYAGPEAVMDEIARVVPVYQGISYSRLADGPLQWPCLDEEDTGRRNLYVGGFPNGKAKVFPAPPLAELPAGSLPFTLIPTLVKFHSGSLSEWSDALLEVCPEPYIEMNRADMKSLGFAEGDAVKATAASGESITAKVKMSKRPVSNTIIVPMHFSGLGLNKMLKWDQFPVQVGLEKA